MGIFHPIMLRTLVSWRSLSASSVLLSLRSCATTYSGNPGTWPANPQTQCVLHHWPAGGYGPASRVDAMLAGVDMATKNSLNQVNTQLAALKKGRNPMLGRDIKHFYKADDGCPYDACRKLKANTNKALESVGDAFGLLAGCGEKKRVMRFVRAHLKVVQALRNGITGVLKGSVYCDARKVPPLLAKLADDYVAHGQVSKDILEEVLRRDFEIKESAIKMTSKLRTIRDQFQLDARTPLAIIQRGLDAFYKCCFRWNALCKYLEHHPPYSGEPFAAGRIPDLIPAHGKAKMDRTRYTRLLERLRDLVREIFDCHHILRLNLSFCKAGYESRITQWSLLFQAVENACCEIDSAHARLHDGLVQEITTACPVDSIGTMDRNELARRMCGVIRECSSAHLLKCRGAAGPILCSFTAALRACGIKDS